MDGYDLDLTYILTNIIAMSFPSKGTKALYRNKIDNVAKFFEEKYSDTENIDYMIYNLCSEMEYDHRFVGWVSAANRLIGEVVQSQRRPLQGPSPG